MPAEWDRHEATWIGWPHNPTDWPGKIEPIHWVYGEIVRQIADGETLRILVNSKRHESRARSVLKSVGVNSRRVEFFEFPTNRGWARDSGPIFVRRGRKPGQVAIVRFRFNAWAKYDDWKKDATVPEKAARALKLPMFRARIDGKEFVLEGGAIDVNGNGTLMTTEECLLDTRVQVRNPGFGRSQIEEALRANLGVKNILWLKDGIAGDDTHGHVDDLCRFVNEKTVLLCREANSRDVNYKRLKKTGNGLRECVLKTAQRSM